jgi:hypothetical protein
MGQIVSGGGFGVGSGGTITGHPYSAKEETETIQTLADGTHITSGGQQVVYYRDSMGRTRTERSMPLPPGFAGDSKAPLFVEIVDPVAGYRYSFNSTSQKIQRMPFGPPPRVVNGKVAANGAVTVNSPWVASKAPVPVSERPRPETKNEELGAQQMEGVLVTGTRTTTVYPVGFFGNDRPLTTVRESWMSRDLGIAVLTKNSDPRSGETTTKTTNISLSVPDPSLFQPPAGAEIVDPAK